MQVFYAPDISNDSYTLDENESKHIIRVLRMKKGMSVRLTDGKGNLYEGVIADADQKRCTISITSVLREFEKRDYRLHIAISPLKNSDRFEWFVEKSVEIGIDEITPIICRNTEKENIKADRINSIIISAMKQSLKSTGTILNEAIPFINFINKEFDAKRMIAHCDNTIPRSKISDVCAKRSDAVVLIGPEGDFSKNEIISAIEADFLPVHLGNSRLRTETAGLAACHSIYLINQ